MIEWVHITSSQWIRVLLFPHHPLPVICSSYVPIIFLLGGLPMLRTQCIKSISRRHHRCQRNLSFGNGLRVCISLDNKLEVYDWHSVSTYGFGHSIIQCGIIRIAKSKPTTYFRVRFTYSIMYKAAEVCQSVCEWVLSLLESWCLRLPRFESCIQQRKTTCLLSIRKSLACVPEYYQN